MFLFFLRNLAAIQDREICCYSISCKEKDNIGKIDCKIKQATGVGKEAHKHSICSQIIMHNSLECPAKEYVIELL